MKTKLVLLSLILFLAAILSSLAAAPCDRGITTLATGNGTFAISLYKVLGDKKGNLFFSPYSISTALSMTYLGARGTTAKEMAKTLCFSQPPAELHPAYRALITDLNGRGASGAYELVTANRLWGQKGTAFVPAFLDDEKKYYGSSLEELDFVGSTEKSRHIINRWVEKQTRDKIKHLLQPGVLTKLTRLVLTNAIYFKSAWSEVFKEGMTREEPFFPGRGEKVTVPMMHRTGHYNYCRTGDAEVALLPYKNNELSMMVILPLEKEGLEKVEQSLSYESVKNTLAKMTDKDLELALPKFKTTSSFSMKETLEKMGMTAPFGMEADFSGMDGTKSLRISAVIHKAFVDVNENGTEAAAATAVAMTLKGMPSRPKNVIPFKVDHPFIFLIRDNKTGSILFMGRIVNPLE